MKTSPNNYLLYRPLRMQSKVATLNLPPLKYEINKKFGNTYFLLDIFYLHCLFIECEVEEIFVMGGQQGRCDGNNWVVLSGGGWVGKSALLHKRPLNCGTVQSTVGKKRSKIARQKK